MRLLHFPLSLAALLAALPVVSSCQSNLPDDWRAGGGADRVDADIDDVTTDDQPDGSAEAGAPATGPTTTTDASVGCGAGTFKSGQVCVAWRTCDPGRYVVEPGTPQSDRRCAACPNGTFTENSNELECQPWSICQPGQHVSLAGTASRDRSCEPCGEGTSTTSANADECVVIGPCPRGTLKLTNADGVAIGCENCESGTYCAGGDAAIEPCEEGDWDHDEDAATRCVAHTPCLGGTYLEENGDRWTDQVCQPCAPGSFTQDVNAVSCQQWQECGPGTYVEIQASAANDVKCTGCASGSFSTDSNAEECTAATDCQPGYFVSDPGNAMTDRTCSECPEGQLSTTINAGSCSEPGACPAGSVETAPATDTTDAECAACAEGSYCAGGTTAEVACAAGTWDHDSDPATPCATKTDCAPGQRVAAEGNTTTDRSCADCAAGSFSTSVNAASCGDWRDCAAGSYTSVLGTSTNDRQCSPCPSQRYSSVSNAPSCTPWANCTAPTFYQTSVPSSTANRGCTACPSGQITTSDNDTACIIPVYQMSGGQVVMEAEHFHSKSDAANDAWSVENISAASGGQVMTVGPDAASGGADWIDYMIVDTSPHFDFNVNFDRTGQFWVFVRGDAAPANPGEGNSCWNSYDDEVFGIPHEFVATPGTWSWVKSGPLNVNSLGLHKIGIYAREDGFRVDKIVVKNSETAITGAGPAESPQE